MRKKAIAAIFLASAIGSLMAADLPPELLGEVGRAQTFASCKAAKLSGYATILPWHATQLAQMSREEAADAWQKNRLRCEEIDVAGGQSIQCNGIAYFNDADVRVVAVQANQSVVKISVAPSPDSPIDFSIALFARPDDLTCESLPVE